ATSEFLGKRNIRLGPPYAGAIEIVRPGAAPDAGTTTTREAPWKTFFLPDGLLPGDPLFFIAYPRGPRDAFLRKLENRNARRMLYHDNTALGLRAVWIATPDLDSASKAYESIGLQRGRAFTDTALDARGLAFRAGAGEIWPLSPASKKSPVA